MACSAYSCVTCPGRPPEWEALDETDLMAFSKGAQARFLEPGATLYLQGDECKGIYCVQTGLVGVRRVDAGGRSALLRLAHPGDILGYSSLLRQVDHLESAESLAPSKICFVGSWVVCPALRRSERLREAFLRRALTELDQLEGDYADLLTKTLRGRLLTLLVSLQRQASARRNADISSFELPLPRKELAALLGATPESVSRMIARLNTEGAVRIAERHVEIHDLRRALEDAHGRN